MGDRPNNSSNKNSYDRFLVNQTIDHYEKEIEDLKRRVNFLTVKLEQVLLLNDEIRERYNKAIHDLESNKSMANSISRLALQEANTIIQSAKDNADDIIENSLSTAREIINELSKLSMNTQIFKEDIKLRIKKMEEEVDNFKIPSIPSFNWDERLKVNNDDQDKHI